MVDSFSSQSIKKNIHTGGLGMVSALGYSCLVHITMEDHQGISNRHYITFAVRRCYDTKVLKLFRFYFCLYNIIKADFFLVTFETFLKL